MVSHQKVQRYLTKVFTHPFLFLLYGVSHLFPRNKKVWVFGMQDRFASNSKYLFLYTARGHAKDVQAIWISRDKKIAGELKEQGFLAYYWISWQGVWYPLRAQFFVYDASVETISYWLSGGATKILLWHAIPLKKVEWDVQKGEAMRAQLFTSRGFLRFLFWFLLPWRFIRPDYTVATSQEFQKIFSSAFLIPKARIWITGFPKNDVYFAEIPGAEIGTDRKTQRRMKELKSQGKKVILYAPTWRDTGGKSFLEDVFFMQRLSLFLGGHDCVLFVKLHPLAKSGEGVRREHIYFVSSQSDVDPLLREVDILLTDYSGIYFEFLLLNRPIVFFPYDYEKYVTKDRELYFDYNKVTPGPKAYTLQELLERIKEVMSEDRYKEQRKKVREMCYTWQDGKASERAYHVLREIAS